MNEIADFLQNALAGGRIVALPLAIVGGVVAGLNPCCLPLYPAATATCCAVRGNRTQVALGSASAFVLGLALTTTALGVLASLAGGALVHLSKWTYYLVALVPLAMGLHVLGWIRFPLPAPQLVTARQGVAGAFVAGVVLSVVLAPCGTPVLASVLSYAAREGSAPYGGLLLFLYGLGAGLPILAASSALGGLAARLRDGRSQSWINRLTGVSLLGLGFYLVWIA